jgi:hypothetical protein
VSGLRDKGDRRASRPFPHGPCCTRAEEIGANLALLERRDKDAVRPAAEEAGQVGLAQGERQGADIVAVEQALA